MNTLWKSLTLSLAALVVAPSSAAEAVEPVASATGTIIDMLDNLDNDVTHEGLLSLLVSHLHGGGRGLHGGLLLLQRVFLIISAGGVGRGHDVRAHGGDLGAGGEVGGDGDN